MNYSCQNAIFAETDQIVFVLNLDMVTLKQLENIHGTT